MNGTRFGRHGKTVLVSFYQLTSLSLVLAYCSRISADDWPEWRGAGRDGIWEEAGVLEKFPEGGLEFVWRTPINAGYAGPAVAGGRVFVTDFEAGEATNGTERVLCLNESNGEILWTRSWPTDYRALMISYATGPRATPTVDDDRVYILGATGILKCLKVETGEPLWEMDYVTDYGTEIPAWGMTGAPLVDGDRLICLVGGENDSKVVAFNKMTGEPIWRALSSNWEPGYCQPFMIDAGGVKQLIIWEPQNLVSLNPASGEVYWSEPMSVTNSVTVATPIHKGDLLMVTAAREGSLMMKLDPNAPKATKLWASEDTNDTRKDALYSLNPSPHFVGDYIYGVCYKGELRCLEARTGQRVWSTQDVTIENGRDVTAFLVRNGDRWFINNDRGELIIAELSPEGYREIDRTKLIKPTTDRGGVGRRELGAVNWTHPAYANRRIYTRNDEEIICASLAAGE